MLSALLLEFAACDVRYQNLLVATSVEKIVFIEEFNITSTSCLDWHKCTRNTNYHRDCATLLRKEIPVQKARAVRHSILNNFRR